MKTTKQQPSECKNNEVECGYSKYCHFFPRCKGCPYSEAKGYKQSIISCKREIDAVNPMNLFGFLNRDLSKYPIIKELIYCPNCESFGYKVEFQKSDYIVDGVRYPLLYNEKLCFEPKGIIHYWEELHCCPKCKRKYRMKRWLQAF